MDVLVTCKYEEDLTMMVQIKFRYDWPTGCGDIQV